MTRRPQKGYLNLIVDEIVLTVHTDTIKGSCGALMHADSIGKIKAGHLKQVPASITFWCARRDSNS